MWITLKKKLLYVDEMYVDDPAAPCEECVEAKNQLEMNTLEPIETCTECAGEREELAAMLVGSPEAYVKSKLNSVICPLHRQNAEIMEERDLTKCEEHKDRTRRLTFVPCTPENKHVPPFDWRAHLKDEFKPAVWRLPPPKPKKKKKSMDICTACIAEREALRAMLTGAPEIYVEAKLKNVICPMHRNNAAEVVITKKDDEPKTGFNWRIEGFAEMFARVKAEVDMWEPAAPKPKPNKKKRKRVVYDTDSDSDSE